MAEARACLVCKKPLKGRSDKKFCDDHCRNTYNNELKSGRHMYIRQVNTILKKNRRILEHLLPANKTSYKTKKEKLQRLGFHLNFYTHTDTSKKGNTYYFCYDYGYTPLEDNWYQIIKNKEEQKT
jgi:predicted nucleic acid-binding Zn ribbon protein/YHS domain-containing protein